MQKNFQASFSDVHKGRERQKFLWDAPSWFLREREATDEAM